VDDIGRTARHLAAWHIEEGPAGALQWHFAAMSLLFVSLTGYLLYGLESGHFRRSLLA
jgi:thiosulfate reductase cytochrome b subunit